MYVFDNSSFSTPEHCLLKKKQECVSHKNKQFHSTHMYVKKHSICLHT